jgi:hypothetical protein
MNLLSLVELDDSSGICVALKTAFAGKPAPTGISGVQNNGIRRKSCGSGLARDEARQIPANALANRLPLAPAARSSTA